MRMRRTIGLSLALLFASAPAMAREIHPVHQHPQTGAKTKLAATAAACKIHRRHHRASDSRKLARYAAHHRAAARPVVQDAPPDQYIGPLRVAGAREVGYAAWYGGHHVGRRTASGERLDGVHATAAHRSLPLHSLVRVTNLRNGRSIVATINDRGPVSHRLLIDVSPSAAAELDMMHSGIAKVAIEPVVEAAGRQ
jgi:rare lipoprotein A (peptidoglycan hydrolase)